MEDPNDSLPTNSSLQKKKSKKKKKKSGNKADQDPQETPKADQEKQPQQTTDRDETIIRTTKCSYCGKSVRQLLRGFKNPENITPGPVVCEICLKAISQQKEEYRDGVPYIEAEKTSGGTGNYRPTPRKPPLKETLCNCVACVSKRDNTVTPEVDRDAHITQSYWMEIRHIVRCIYRENMSLSAVSNRDSIGSDKMRSIVRKLCCRDPHQFFQRLETLAREYLLEVKVRLLEQLSCGFNSPQLAIEFIQMLLDEYSSLCAALPALLYLLEPLEETEYIRRLGVTIELVNKNIFRELIFAESFMSGNLPLIIAQLRLASLSSDPFHRSSADALSQRYNNLDDEMDMIGNVWNTAKDQLKQQQQQQQESKRREERRAHIEKILSDGESFIKKHTKKEQQQQQNEEYTTAPVQASTDKIQDKSHEASDNTSLSHSRNVTNHKLPSSQSDTHSSSSSSSSSKTVTSSSPKPLSPSSSSVILHDQPILTPLEVEDIKDNDGWMTKEQISEWSKILFKCIKPIGEPEFRITDNIATHTITLKIDMTAIDLRHAESVCTHEQVRKYEELGMRREEIAEVALKLNAIKHLGINLRIDDLFDEHGFVIVDGNEYHEEREDAVYFVEEGKHSVKGKEKLLEEELNRSGLVDLQNEKEKVICREENEVGEGRETDLLQSMTMKIRFMKSVPDEDTKTRLMSDSEQVMFESCDQVQMKLTQLELNTMRLMCTNKCLALNLGIRKRKASVDVVDKDEERFVHTDTNQPFVGLLLEQGKQAEQQKKDNEEKTAINTNEEDTKEEQEKEEEGEEVKDQQVPTAEDEVVTKVPEQVSSEESRPEVPVTPPAGVCIPSQSHSCQCFACIGAVAAQITEGSLHPLNPVDPCGSKLTIKDMMSAKLHSSDTADGDHDREQKLLEQQQSNKSVSNKAEHLWQNWMSSTTHSSPDISDSGPVTPTPEPNLSSCETTTPEQPSTPVTNNSDSGNSSLSLATTCSDGGTTVTTPSNGTCTTSVCPNEEHHNHVAAATHKGTGNCPVKRYCPCCYCELFGQNTPTVPTSHNYTKQRDKMRQKLEKKRKQEHVYCHHGHTHHHHDESQRSHSPIDVHQEHQQQHHHHHHHHHHVSPPHHNPQPTPSPPPPSSSPLHPHPPVSRNNTSGAAATDGGKSNQSQQQQQQQQQHKKEKSLDEILKFIEGDDFNESKSNTASTSTSTTKSKKKKKGKKKSEAEPTLPISNGHVTTTSSDNGGSSDSNSATASSGKKGGKKEERGNNGSQQQNGGLPQQKKATSSHNQQGSQKSAGKINSPKQSHKKTNRTSSSHSNGLPKSSYVRSDHQLHSELSDMDEDYDKEIEEFKKLCLNSAPVESRKKIHVSLNMQDILSKVK